MYFKQFLHDDFGCSSYLIASRESREAAVIDPQRDVQQYLDLAAERGYDIVAIIDTHLHADHVSGNRDLAAATGGRLYLYDEAEVLFPFQGLRDGAEVKLGQIILSVVHTPGHRPEALSLLVINPSRSPEPSMVLSGDCLFVGDVGRPDFGGPEGAAQQYQSVQRLLRLEDYVEVYPAHFEGACGKAMCGRPSSTIGFERRFNPVLQLPEPEFLKLTAEAPARPLNMTAILAANRGEAGYPWPHVGHDVKVPSVGVGEAVSWLNRHQAFVVDVREPWEYAEGHIPGALSVPQAELASRLAELPQGRAALIACASGNRSLRAAAFLKAAGYDLAASLAEGTHGWKEAGNPVEKGS